MTDSPIKPKGIWDYPAGFNFAVEEGRQDYRRGFAIEYGDIYGESLHGRDWRWGWRAEQARQNKLTQKN